MNPRFTFSRLLTGLLLVGSTLGINACDDVNYSDEPEISPNRVDYSVLRETNEEGNVTGEYDQFNIVINYQDGDGDLGLNTDDTNPPFQELNSNGTANKFNKNYFIDIYTQAASSSTWEKRTFPFTYNSRFPRLSDDRKEPIRGQIEFGAPSQGGTPSLRFSRGSTFTSGTKVRFEISIADRALHVSNTITTEPVTIQ